MSSTTGLAPVQPGLIRASANPRCGNTQGPNLFTQNLQWHNPITQPVIGPFHTVQHSTGSVSHSQPCCLSGEQTGCLIFQGARLTLSPSLSLSYPPLSSLPCALCLSSLFLTPSLPPCLSPLFLSPPSAFCPPSLSPLATVTASLFFLLDNRKPYLAVCSAPPWQSCQFTCLDCRILYLVSKTHCNYNPCISKCTWYTAISDQHPVSYPHLSQTLYSTWFHNQQTQPFKCKKTAITCHCLLNRCVREKCTLGGSEQQTRLGSWSISECRCYTLNNAGLCIESIQVGIYDSLRHKEFHLVAPMFAVPVTNPFLLHQVLLYICEVSNNRDFSFLEPVSIILRFYRFSLTDRCLSAQGAVEGVKK